MVGFDDLAFAPPPRDTATAARRSAPELYCPACEELVSRTTPDRKRCLICGHELESRRQEQHAPTSNGGPQDFLQIFQDVLARLDPSGAGGFGDARRPATAEAVNKLGSFLADQASTIEVAVAVSGIKGEVIAVPANFGPCDSVPRAPIVAADPIDGASTLANSNALSGKIVIMRRGACTFAQKVLRAQAAGALAVLIVQTFDVWPYTMTDSKGESAETSIPTFMLSMKQGERFLAFLDARPDKNDELVAEITVRKNARECVICQVEMAIGATLTRMPCQHMFHTDCLHEWLKIGNSCPICRVEIASAHGH
ncbi:hypothetical protein PINS_up001136 [Pythium insidiosum]|nr:hypothetical protein PINS_up001136 [Pythium insidiosum]